MRVVCTYPFERTGLTCGPGCPCHSRPWLCRHMSCGSQPCSRQWNRLGFSSTVFPWKWGSDRAQEQGRRSSTFSPTVIYLQSASICCPCAPRSKGAEGCSGWTDGTGVSTGSTEPSFTQENMPAPLFVICGSCKLQLEVTGGVLDMGGVEECLFISRVG